MTVIELAVYAAVLGQAQPMLCRLETSLVTCSNGYAMVVPAEGLVRFSDGTTVQKDDKGFPAFSNGIHSWLGSAQWLHFSNGVSVRRITNSEYRFGNGLVCRVEVPILVSCSMRAPLAGR
jgi:hypothetical protein